MVSHHSDRPEDGFSSRDLRPHSPERQREIRALRRFIPPPRAARRHDAPGSAHVQSLDERIECVLMQAGFLPLLVEHEKVILSGFVVIPIHEGAVCIRWIGCDEVNSLPYRRTFLGVYALVLRQGGFDVTYLGAEEDPHLIARLAPRRRLQQSQPD